MKNIRLNLTILLASLITLTIGTQASFAAQNDVAIVHSYSDKISWVVNQSNGFRQRLGSDFQYTEYMMDTKEIKESEFDKVAADIIAKINHLKPTMVYVTDDNALKLVGRYVDPSIPVVFSGVNANLREDYPWLLKSNNITGVLERPLIKRNLIETMKAFDLKAKKILILMDDSLTAEYFFKLDLHSKQKFSVKEAKAEVYRSGNFADWKKKILSSKEAGYDLLLLAGAFALQEENGESISAIDVAKWISEHSPIPPFTSHLQQIGQGMLIGGLQLNGEIMGSDAAVIARSILFDKTKPKEIFPQTQTAGDLKFSKIEIEKQGLKLNPKYNNHIILLD